MSLAACAKKILCDPDVTRVEACYNCLKFLDIQAKMAYKNDPEPVLEIKEMVLGILNVSLKDPIKEVVEELEKI